MSPLKNRKRFARRFPTPIIRLRLLGTYDVIVAGRTIGAPATAKARSLLAYLALQHDETVRREIVMHEFWPDADVETPGPVELENPYPPGSLQTALFRAFQLDRVHQWNALVKAYEHRYATRHPAAVHSR